MRLAAGAGPSSSCAPSIARRATTTEPDINTSSPRSLPWYSGFWADRPRARDEGFYQQDAVDAHHRHLPVHPQAHPISCAPVLRHDNQQEAGQGQDLEYVGLYLPQPSSPTASCVYVAFSRVRQKQGLKVFGLSTRRGLQTNPQYCPQASFLLVFRKQITRSEHLQESPYSAEFSLGKCLSIKNFLSRESYFPGPTGPF